MFLVFGILLIILGLSNLYADTTYLKCENYTIPEPTVIEGNITTIEKIVYVDRNATEPAPLKPTPAATNSELFSNRIIWGEGGKFPKDTAFIGKIKLEFVDGNVLYGYTNNTGSFNARIPIQKRFYLFAFDGDKWIKYADTIVIDKNHNTVKSPTGTAPWKPLETIRTTP